MKRILKRLSEKADRLASTASEHKNKIVAAGTVVLGTAQAQAAMDLTGVSFVTTDAMAVGTLILGATAVVWGVLKAISVANRA